MYKSVLFLCNMLNILLLTDNLVCRPIILGVTFTLIWIDGAGVPTDLDNNKKNDVAFREIYYNDNFTWAIDGNIDVETVALHEAGHGLSQAHFGDIFITDSNGKLHFSPRAVMNATYSGVQQEIAETDTQVIVVSGQAGQTTKTTRFVW